MRYLSLLLFAFLIVGCVPDSEAPLTDPNKEQIDVSILGTWLWKDKSESGFIHIGLDKKSKLLRLIMVDFDRDEEMEASEFLGHTSLLEENRYLNLKWVHPPQDHIHGYIFVKYEVGSETLGIALMDGKVVEKAMESSSLKGKLEKDKLSYSIHITEDQKKLQGFVRRNDKALFPEMNYLHVCRF